MIISLLHDLYIHIHICTKLYIYIYIYIINGEYDTINKQRSLILLFIWILWQLPSRFPPTQKMVNKTSGWLSKDISAMRETMYWLVVEPTPLKNMKVNWDDDIPTIWKNNPNVQNHQPVVMSASSASELRWLLQWIPPVAQPSQPSCASVRPGGIRLRRLGILKCVQHKFLWRVSIKASVKSMTGWWFELLWKILVNWDDYPRYMGK